MHAQNMQTQTFFYSLSRFFFLIFLLPMDLGLIIYLSKTHLSGLSETPRHISHNQHSLAVLFLSHSPLISMLSILSPIQSAFSFSASLCVCLLHFSFSVLLSFPIRRLQVVLSRFLGSTKNGATDRRAAILLLMEVIHYLLQVWDVFISHSVLI